MNKQEFIDKLRMGLSVLSEQDIEEHIAFYSEMIDDRMEEGLTEEDAVAQLGSVDKIISQIIADTPLKKIVKQKLEQKRSFKVWEIVLIALGSPIWFSLLVAAVAVILSVYVSVWSVIVSLWAVFASFAACALAGVFYCGVLLLKNTYLAFLSLAASLVLAGLSIFTFFGCKLATKGILLLTKKVILCIKKCFAKKEEV